MLADLLLRDVYGPQRLIARRHLPPHLVTGHPQFLRPLCGSHAGAATCMCIFIPPIWRARPTAPGR